MLPPVEMSEKTEALYNAPFAFLMHNRFGAGVADEDAVFTYANKVRTVLEAHGC